MRQVTDSQAKGAAEVAAPIPFSRRREQTADLKARRVSRKRRGATTESLGLTTSEATPNHPEVR